ncbi:TPA: 50S ribosome-binding GTPase [Pluralibacter gergoviae]|uniref:GTP binding protein n=1 Tax=Pluralibacter gergoviae TaxID=61647 RepID=A0A0J5LCF8_PLUGE|nr:nucleoside recognition domain-containing protein [Pluralibacter gergoviae]KMK16039.1 GTP binding protein [Pluralibacter gergoviae]KMK27272.1 GTP binding protein [Pluralibacter gergoviae]MBL3693740.1 ferrous iron transporter B [Pluralibacter gergoviae]HDS1153509.1 50S ribosome-binding GTPase [Pluralibacter gergoviae]
MSSFVLMGMESAGKSTLFNLLTASGASDERNFRGSTVVCREGRIADIDAGLVDTPGIRVRSDSETTRLALAALDGRDGIVMILRATHAGEEWEALRDLLPARPGRLLVLLTFADKVKAGLESAIDRIAAASGAAVLAVNAREADGGVRGEILSLLGQPASPPRAPQAIPVVNIVAEAPPLTLFERPYLGRPAAVACLFLLFAIPVWLAWLLSDLLQPVADALIIGPLAALTAHFPPLLQNLLTGSYGLFSLGIYSFIWAFPVVLLVGVSIAATEESGLKARITAALDPWLRRVGLSGQDLIPALSGFGCNAVAVFQSRACSRCSRKACVSMISFGSACSYQTGATLSLFNSAHQPWLFAPWLLLLFITGALHTRLWHRALSADESARVAELTWLQRPRWRSVGRLLRNTLRQFLRQAMPLFLLICLVAGALDYAGATRWLSGAAAPLLGAVHLPPDLMPGIIFSLLRKDGMMVLNQDGGRALQALSTLQLLLLVWIASTLMACLVTVYTVAREIGWRFALSLVARQALSSLSAALAVTLLFHHGAGL